MANESYEIGTWKYLQYLKQNTPGEKVEEYIREMQKSSKENSKKHFSAVFDNPLKGFPYNEEFDVTEISEEAIAEVNEEDLEEDADVSLRKKADKTGIPFGILKQVYKRGVAAWRTGHRPGTTPEQWGHARVNSFATKGKGTWGGADKDLAAKVK